MKSYIVAVASFQSYSVELYKVQAASILEAAIIALKPLEGFDEWRWDTFHSLKTLQGEISQCDMALNVVEI